MSPIPIEDLSECFDLAACRCGQNPNRDGWHTTDGTSSGGALPAPVVRNEMTEAQPEEVSDTLRCLTPFEARHRVRRRPLARPPKAVERYATT